jgi:hypothetical protein
MINFDKYTVAFIERKGAKLRTPKARAVPTRSLKFWCNPGGASLGCREREKRYNSSEGRLEEIKGLSRPELCGLLGERGVPCAVAETTAQLVTKVVVTDAALRGDRKTGNVVTSTNAAGQTVDEIAVTSRAAPAATLVDPHCLHGCHRASEDTAAQVAKRDLVNMYISDHRATAGFFEQRTPAEIGLPDGTTALDVAINSTFDFWMRHQQSLQADTERFIPA